MRTIAAFILTGVLAAVAPAAESWDVARTTAPKDVAELKALQTKLKGVVEKVTPSTVAVFYGAGAGSGVIVSEDGLVLTAAHVVSPNPLGGGFGRRSGDTAGLPPKNVTLMLADGKRIKGVVLGRNSRMDSAMVKITDAVPKTAKWPGASEGKWPAVELGKSADLKKGQWVVSLGHPGGPKDERRAPVRLGQMVNVTPDGRRISSDCTLVGGDSGGPLFDLDGKLIGIHSSIGMDLAQNFHVPTHGFQQEWKRLLRGDWVGMTTGAWLGIVLEGDFAGKDRDGKEIPYTRNKTKPRIEAVSEGSPAESAGLKAGDLILEFKGEKVETSEDIDHMMSGTRAGENVLVKLRRGDDTYELEVTLGKRPGN